MMMCQEPIQIVAVDKFNQRVGHLFKAVAWIIITAYPQPDNKWRYVYVPIDSFYYDETKPVHLRRMALACDFENALYSLQYLIDHPTETLL